MTDRETAWRDVLSAHSSSGMPLSRYCRDKGLNYHQAVYWRRRRLVRPGHARPDFFARGAFRAAAAGRGQRRGH